MFPERNGILSKFKCGKYKFEHVKELSYPGAN